MGLIIRPKSKLRAFHCRLYSWQSLKMVMRGTPLDIPWENISQILITNHSGELEYNVFYELDSLNSNLAFYPDEVADINELEAFIKAHPQKIERDRAAVFRKNYFAQLKYHFKYGAVIEAYMLGSFAFIFMFYQLKYFGSLSIQKYQFLIKTSCNQQCAETLWTISADWFFWLIYIIGPLIPIIFYKKVFKSIARSKSVNAINVTMIQTVLLASVGIFLMFHWIPSFLINTTKYSRILSYYSDGTLESKISQKIEMASKRKFQGDIDEVEVLEDQREE